MSKKKLCGLDYCPQEEMIGAYANCLACAWGNDNTEREWKKPMNDSISRKGVSAWLYNMGHEKLSEYVLDEKRFPSIDRQQGEWVGEADGYADGEFVYDTWYCSNCDYAIDDDEPPAWNFCPMCGIRMSGAK